MVTSRLVPKGATDCHIHIYGPRDRYTLAPTCPAEPPLALTDDYKVVQKRLGLSRVVVVQPAAYGTDNTCTLDAVDQIGSRARAVVVVTETTSDKELDFWHSKGARGARFFLLRGAVVSTKSLNAVAERIAQYGWHIQLQCDGRQLSEMEKQLIDLNVCVVIDHVGKFLEPVSINDPAFKALRRLVDTGRFWIKLSAPYETSRTGPPVYEDVGVLARELIYHVPERLVWGTNWPHPMAFHEPPDDEVLLNTLYHWCPDESILDKILVDNPKELYGF